MKFLVPSLFVFAFVATAFSAPVEQDGKQLPPIGPMNPVHEVMMNAAKKILAQVQDNLRAAHHPEEAHHVKKMIEKTEKMLAQGKAGVLQAEQFDLEDHLAAVYGTLEKYREYLPTQKKNNFSQVSLIVPTLEELHQHLAQKMDEMVKKLKANNQWDRAYLLQTLKKAMDLLVKKDAHLTHIEEFANLVGHISETLATLEKHAMH